MNMYNKYKFDKDELNLIDKIKNKETIKYDDYIKTIKKFCSKYQTNNELDKESNQIIYTVHHIFNLHYESNEMARGTKYFVKYIKLKNTK